MATQVTLAEPIEFGEDVHTVLTIRKVKMGDFVEAEKHKSETMQGICIVARVADLAIPVVKEMGMADFKACLDACGAADLGNSLGTGET